MNTRINTYLVVAAVLLVPFVVVAMNDLPVWLGFVVWAKIAAFAGLNALTNA